MSIPSVDLNASIPNNVGLADDPKVRRALEHWQPKYLEWWRDMGPSDFAEREVYLRTAVSVEPGGILRVGERVVTVVGLGAALAATRIDGVETNVEQLAAVVASPRYTAELLGFLGGQGVSLEQIQAVEQTQPIIAQAIKDYQSGGNILSLVGALGGALIIVARVWFTTKLIPQSLK